MREAAGERPAVLVEMLFATAEVLLTAGKPDMAAEKLDEVEPAVERLAQPRLTHRLFGLKGLVHEVRGDVDVALMYLTQQEPIARLLGELRYVGDCMEAQARVLGALGRAPEALRAAEEALVVAETLGAPGITARRAGIAERLRVVVGERGLPDA